jgi:3,4-dihydroxy 2-butanone 4-phosphate synthase / GTP cyclohydrolase II
VRLIYRGMQLSEWLAREGMSRKRFAEMIGVSPGHITGLCDGTTWPGRKVAQRIFDETKGEVAPEDFFKIEEDAAQ